MFVRCPMIYPFFALAAQSHSRQEAFRSAVITHLLVVAGCAWYVLARGPSPGVVVGHVLLVMRIIEGAVLIGWRLNQLTKSIALEFLLVSQLSSKNLLLSELLVGVARLAWCSSQPPVLLFLTTVTGHDPSVGYDPLPPRVLLIDLVTLVGMPFTWGLVTGLSLTAWAYESFTRRWGERITLSASSSTSSSASWLGELFSWLSFLPRVCRRHQVVLSSIHQTRRSRLMHVWLGDHPGSFLDNLIVLEVGACWWSASRRRDRRGG